jgi:conjugative transposon TraM protein
MNTHEAPQEAIQQLDDLQIQRKQQGLYLLIMLGILLFAAVLIYFLTRKTDTKQTAKENDIQAIDPPKAKPKDMYNDKKYINEYGSDKASSISPNDDATLTAISGVAASEQRSSNEGLTASDYQQVRGYSQKASSPKKQKIYEQTRTDIQQASSKNSYYSRPNTPIFRKSPEDLEEEKLTLAEKKRNDRLAEMVMSNMENASKPGYASQTGPGSEQRPAPALSVAYGAVNKTVEAEPEGLRPLNPTSTLGNRYKKSGFFQSSVSNSSISPNTQVRAVIHGNADGITVLSGSAIKIRTVADTWINNAGIRTFVPAHTLLTGKAEVNDRLYIGITAIRIDNEIIPCSIEVYDLDGARGLYIPNEKEKRYMNEQIVQAATRQNLSPYMFNQSAKQQIGVNLASNASNALMQGANQLLSRKSRQSKAFIKPNVQIYLKTQNITENENTTFAADR